jgi:hypothetical protein
LAAHEKDHFVEHKTDNVANSPFFQAKIGEICQIYNFKGYANSAGTSGWAPVIFAVLDYMGISI